MLPYYRMVTGLFLSIFRNYSEEILRLFDTTDIIEEKSRMDTVIGDIFYNKTLINNKINK